MHVPECPATLGRAENEDLAEVGAEQAAWPGDGRVGHRGAKLGDQGHAVHARVLELFPGVLVDGGGADKQVNPYLVSGKTDRPVYEYGAVMVARR